MQETTLVVVTKMSEPGRNENAFSHRRKPEHKRNDGNRNQLQMRLLTMSHPQSHFERLATSMSLSFVMYVLLTKYEWIRADEIQNLHKHQKVDDDDGHYIVSPNVPLTDRCMSYTLTSNPQFTDVSQMIS